MAEYDNTNRGAFFKNERKQTDKHPDYTGNINVCGVEYWLSGWLKVSQKGTTFLSLAIKPKEDVAVSQAARDDFEAAPEIKPTGSTKESAKVSLDDEIPF